MDRTLWIVLIATVCGILGCRPIGRLFEQQAATMRPEQFAGDPVLRSLAQAVDRGDAAAIEAAVKAGADVNAYGSLGYRILYWAMARGQVEGFQQLLKQGAVLTKEYRDSSYLRGPSYNRTVLEKVIENKDQRFLNAALRQGLDPDYEFHAPSGVTLLFLAVWSHSQPSMETLLNAGANINWQDYLGHTPLVDAMRINDYNAAHFLLERGADPSLKNPQGQDCAWGLKQWGSRGVRPEHRESFERLVDELVRRGLLTRQDIVEANKAKTPNPGVTVIEHSPSSEVGQAILQLDQAEREANARDGAR